MHRERNFPYTSRSINDLLGYVIGGKNLEWRGNGPVSIEPCTIPLGAN
jgi:hypothetical protein